MTVPVKTQNAPTQVNKVSQTSIRIIIGSQRPYNAKNNSYLRHLTEATAVERTIVPFWGLFEVDDAAPIAAS